MTADHRLLRARLRGIHYALVALTFAVLAVAMGFVPGGGRLMFGFSMACFVTLFASFSIVTSATVDGSEERVRG